MALIIDLASTSRALRGDDLRRWAEDRTAFVSSEMEQLSDERAVLARTLRELGMRVVLFEDLGGRDENPERAYLDGVARSDIYVGIVGDRYGTMLDSGRSPTHEEYREARRLGKKISVWAARDGSGRQGHARDFLQEVRVFHTTGSFIDGDDLAARVVERIAEIAADDESPWVKVGDAVFRADMIRDEGTRIRIEATVRDDRVARYLDGLRSSRHGREQVQISTADRSGAGTVEEVITETTSRSVRHVTVTASIEWPDQWGESMAGGASGYSADDLVELGLRAGVLGEALPTELGPLDFMAEPADPLAPLRGERIAEGSVEAIGRLLTVEYLTGGRKASVVESVEIGPEHEGRPDRLPRAPPGIERRTDPAACRGNMVRKLKGAGPHGARPRPPKVSYAAARPRGA